MRWGFLIVPLMLWCFVISANILKNSSSSDFNYTKGSLESINRYEKDVKNRIGGKIGTAHTVKFLLNNSNTTFYIDNNFSALHNQYIKLIKSSNTIEIWSDGDLFDGSEERVYKLVGDGITIIPLELTKELYVEKSQVMMYLAIITSIMSLIVIRPKWFQILINNSNDNEASLVGFYLEKFKSRKTEELEDLIRNKSDFHPDAVKAAEQTLRQR